MILHATYYRHPRPAISRIGCRHSGFPSAGGRGGFTLIEIMIALSIVVVILAVGLPNMLGSLNQNALRKAVRDVVEGCSEARSMAILRGQPAEFILRAQDGHLTVRQAAREEEDEPAGSARSRDSKSSSQFSEHLDRDVAVEQIFVNFDDKMAESEVRVRFYPNGTSEEFTVILASTRGAYQISLDVVTGLAYPKQIR